MNPQDVADALRQKPGRERSLPGFLRSRWSDPSRRRPHRLICQENNLAKNGDVKTEFQDPSVVVTNGYIDVDAGENIVDRIRPIRIGVTARKVGAWKPFLDSVASVYRLSLVVNPVQANVRHHCLMD